MRSTKRDIIAAELRRQITSGELPRGSRVNQDELAARFSTSITPVREALSLLQAQGVLVSEAHRGVRVVNADLASVRTVYLLRQLVEPYAMRRAVWHTSRRDLQAASDLVEKMDDCLAADDREAYIDANRRFHFTFYELCDDDGLLTEVTLLWQRYPWDLLQVVKERSAESQAEHKRILEAAKAGELTAVAEATREHLRLSYLSLAACLEPDVTHEDPFVVPEV